MIDDSPYKRIDPRLGYPLMLRDGRGLAGLTAGTVDAVLNVVAAERVREWTIESSVDPPSVAAAHAQMACHSRIEMIV